MTEETFDLDDETIRKSADLARRLGKSESEILAQAVLEYRECLSPPATSEQPSQD